MMIKFILKSCNLIFLFFWISYTLDAFLPAKEKTEKVQWSKKLEYRGRGAGSGNFYFNVKTGNYFLNSANDIEPGTIVFVKITPIYNIVKSFCIQNSPSEIKCLENHNSPYSRPLYILLIVVLVMFILYTLIFEKELRFLKRLTLGNVIATIIFASVFLLGLVL